MNTNAMIEEGDRAQEAWAKFLLDWENQVIKTDKERFREALIQMPLIVTALLLDFEKAHIEAVMAGGGPKPSAGSSSRITTSVSGRRVHHTRRMNHIIEHHARVMRKLGY
jgi:hypothetical protein